jgi:hypothetical protein
VRAGNGTAAIAAGAMMSFTLNQFQTLTPRGRRRRRSDRHRDHL